jgi:hypothetical protein
MLRSEEAQSETRQSDESGQLVRMLHEDLAQSIRYM